MLKLRIDTPVGYGVAEQISGLFTLSGKELTGYTKPIHARGSHVGFCPTGKRNVCHMGSENIGRKITLISKPEKECYKH